MIGRVQVETDKVAHLFDEERIGRELEAAGAMGLNGEGLKQSMHRGFRDATGLGGLPHRPVCTRRGLARKGSVQQSCNPVIFDASWPSRA